MSTVADRAEFPGCFCPEPLTAQARCDSFNVIFRQLICKTGRTITLFYFSEGFTDCRITDLTELLPMIQLMAALAPGILAAAGHAQHTTHSFYAELCPMIFDEDILHFRRFAKYVAAFWRMASSSSRSASRRLRRAISTDCCCSRSESAVASYARRKVVIHTC